MPNTKPYYLITECCADVAERLRGGADHSRTTIRCAINDQFDAKGKDGFLVKHDYNQTKAIDRVRKHLGYTR